MYPMIPSPAPYYSLHHEDNDVSEKNFFDYLPDAIILSIFDKLHDYKTLILCSLVSRRFYYLTSQIDTIQLHINYLENKHSQPNRPFPILNFFKNIITPTKWSTKIKNSSISPIPNFSLVPSHVLAQLNHKFPQIKNLQVKLHSCENNFEKNDSSSSSNSNNNAWPFIKWKAIFGSCLESCVVLSASSLRKKNNDTTSKYNRSALKGGLSEIDLKWIMEATKCYILNASFRLIYYVPHNNNNTKKNESLESVVVLDDCGKGKLCMGKEQIEEFNKIFHVENDGFGFDSPEKMRRQRLRSVEGPFQAKVWYVPVLDLPVCGYVMKKVTLVVVKRLESEIVMERDVELLMGAFGEDEDGKVCDEALMEIAKFDEKKCYDVKIPCSLD